MDKHFIDLLHLEVEKNYGIRITDIELLRVKIGSVFLIQTTTDKYVLKLYEYDQSENCRISALIQNTLSQKAMAPHIILNLNDHFSSRFAIEKQQYYAILMEYIDGEEMSGFSLDSDSLTFIENMHAAIQTVSKDLPNHGYNFYIKRFLDLLKEKMYDSKKSKDFEENGNYLYHFITHLKKGVCHGDFHTGNMKSRNGNILLFDFDACANATPFIDYATIFNASNFNLFSEHDYFETKDIFKSISMNNEELFGMLAFVGIRHYELIATIGYKEGVQTISNEFLDQQHFWLAKWCELIKKDITECL